MSRINCVRSTVLRPGDRLNLPKLRRRQLVVENHDADIGLGAGGGQQVEFAATKKRRRVRARALLRDAQDDLRARRLGQTRQLVHRLFCGQPSTWLQQSIRQARHVHGESGSHRHGRLRDELTRTGYSGILARDSTAARPRAAAGTRAPSASTSVEGGPPGDGPASTSTETPAARARPRRARRRARRPLALALVAVNRMPTRLGQRPCDGMVGHADPDQAGRPTRPAAPAPSRLHDQRQRPRPEPIREASRRAG